MNIPLPFSRAALIAAAACLAAAPALAIETVPAAARQEPRFETLPASVAADRRAVLAAKIPGQIGEILAAPGAKVKAGDILVRLVARENEARLARAQAGLAQAQAELPRLDAEALRAAEETRRAKAELARAKADWERVQTLGPASVSRRDAESSQAAFTGAGAVAAGAEAAQKAVEAAKASALAAVEAAKAARDEAKTFLSYAAVTAPFDGVVVRKRAQEGDLANPGQPLLEIEDAALRVEVQVPDALIAALRLGQKIPVAAGDKELEAVVGEIAPASDPATRTTLVRLVLPAGAPARVGAFVRVKVPAEEVRVLRVPKACLVERGQLDLVWVAEKGVARLRLVRTGTQTKDGVEITAGLEPGDAVIVPGQATAKLAEGDAVEGGAK